MTKYFHRTKLGHRTEGYRPNAGPPLLLYVWYRLIVRIDVQHHIYGVYLFISSSGRWGKIEFKLTTLTRIFIHTRRV